MMIATGGLLRIKRQEDKNQPPKPPRKRKKKRRSEVVVIKGRLKLCSLSGVVALLGIMVLMVGGAMASLGYWPKDAAFTSINTTITTVTTDTTSINTTSNTTTSITTATSTNPEGETGDDFNLNKTDNFNNTKQGFLEQFLERYLCDERLKVVGPLVMGAGLFLFICANAVLHESRDRHTKVINLRDIYSTTIDLHLQQRRQRRRDNNNNGGLANPALKDEEEEEGGKPTTGGKPPPSLGGSSDFWLGGGGGEGEGPGVFSIYTPLHSYSRAPLCPSPPSPLPMHIIDPHHDPIGPDTDLDPIGPDTDPKHDPIGPNTDLGPIGPNIDPKHDPIGPNSDLDPIGPNTDPDPIDTNISPIDANPKHDPIKPDPDPKHDPSEPNTDPDLNPDPSLSSQTAVPVHHGR